MPENDLLNGKYGSLSIQVIADWLGHSPKVMLRHYGRVHENDFQQVIQSKTDPSPVEKLAVYSTVQRGVRVGMKRKQPLPLLTQPLIRTALNGKERQQDARDLNCPDCPNGEDRIRTCGTLTHSRI